jgi:thiol-disulfide isomerase/thioredoxin
MKILDFGALWCPGCLIMRPRLEEIKNLYPEIEIIEYDYDEDEDLVNKWNIGYILPVFVFIKNDQEIKRLVGEINVKDFIKTIEEVKDDKCEKV